MDTLLTLDTATPFPYRFNPAHTALVVIDMQRDFIEPGGFGASLGNDVTRLQAIIPAVRGMLDAWRAIGGVVLHTREAHREDLSDCPAAKRARGNPSLRIGDAGPMGRILVAGEPGNAIIPELAPVRAHHDSRAGRIEAAWTLEGDDVTYTVTVPANAKGTLVLNPTYKDATVDGKPLATPGGHENARSLLAPGKHTITFRISR